MALAHIPRTHVIRKLSVSSGRVVDSLISNIIHCDVSTHAALQGVLQKTWFTQTFTHTLRTTHVGKTQTQHWNWTQAVYVKPVARLYPILTRLDTVLLCFFWGGGGFSNFLKLILKNKFFFSFRPPVCQCQSSSWGWDPQNLMVSHQELVNFFKLLVCFNSMLLFLPEFNSSEK